MGEVFQVSLGIRTSIFFGGRRMNNKSRGRKSALFRALIIVCFVCLCSSMLVVQTKATQAFAEDDSQYSIPANAVDMWVDIESPNVTTDSVNGALADKRLPFSKTANGITAISNIVDSRGKNASLTFSAKSPIRVLLAVTLVTSEGKIVSEYSESLDLTKKQSTVCPKFISNPSHEGGSTNTSHGLTRYLHMPRNLSTTGIVVTSIAMIALIFMLIAGLSLYLRHKAPASGDISLFGSHSGRLS